MAKIWSTCLTNSRAGLFQVGDTFSFQIMPDVHMLMQLQVSNIIDKPEGIYMCCKCNSWSVRILPLWERLKGNLDDECNNTAEWQWLKQASRSSGWGVSAEILLIGCCCLELGSNTMYTGGWQHYLLQWKLSIHNHSYKADAYLYCMHNRNMVTWLNVMTAVLASQATTPYTQHTVQITLQVTFCQDFFTPQF